jgi:hypothetical protein
VQKEAGKVTAMSKHVKALAVAASLGAGVVAARGVMGQTSTATVDPYTLRVLEPPTVQTTALRAPVRSPTRASIRSAYQV